MRARTRQIDLTDRVTEGSPSYENTVVKSAFRGLVQN